jgi:hypothetical protein
VSASCGPDCSAHHCHAYRCRVHVPPRMLMCRPHWFMAPWLLRAAVLHHYRPGQEHDKRPSPAYMAAAVRAIAAVAEREDVRQRMAHKVCREELQRELDQEVRRAQRDLRRPGVNQVEVRHGG